LGFSSIFSLSYALAFHLLHASYWTSTSWFLNPLLPVYVDRIHRAKHGSDTGSYDHDGHFRIQALEENFKKYDK
jgi:peroxygenase